MPQYKITWFDSKKQRVSEKIFTGGNAYEKAVKWGKKTLTNFNHDLIHCIYN